jgi:CRP-like cAMP-binding protein
MESNILDIIQDMHNPETFAAGKTVFIEGKPGYTMYVVLEGHVEICVGGKTLEVAGPGSVIGEMALINLSKRSATAIAQDDCTLASIDDVQFLSLIVRRPQFALSVMEIMANRLRHMDTIVQSQSHPAPPKRLGNCLCHRESTA